TLYVLCVFPLVLSTLYVMTTCIWLLFLFFFQAEDGIRDSSVTGVQTCALPIYVLRLQLMMQDLLDLSRAEDTRSLIRSDRIDLRSEERRVGKECRCRGWQGDSKKNKGDGW